MTAMTAMTTMTAMLPRGAATGCLQSSHLIIKIRFRLKNHWFFLFLAFLTTQMLRNEEDMWIGMNDVNWEMHFVWTDGKGISYTNWAKGHPSSSPDGRFSHMSQVK